ncbi:MAG TPA: hypothetical protein VKB75_08230, partial [Jatrophihabitans sp.]|nr:hypothetical protein [Jatrophihabitans sp.]
MQERSPAAPPRPFVVGSLDRRMAIERIAFDVQAVLGFAPEDLIGSPLSRLVVPTERGRFTDLVARAGRSADGAGDALAIRSRSGAPRLCHLLLRRGGLGPGYSFALILNEAEPEAGEAERSLPATLSPRESEVVNALVDGDRPPAIARNLHLTPATVRN